MSGNTAEFKVDPEGWVHLTPFGEFPHHAGIVQVIDRRSVEGMVKRFNEKRDAEGDAFAGILLDYDHFSMDTDKPSEAAGWIVGMEVRDDGLWGKVRWSDEGLKAVTGGRYRFVSLVFPPANEFEPADEADATRKRPLAVVSCALTNEPNIKGGKPIANRVAGTGSAAGGKTPKAQAEEKIPGTTVGGDGAARYMWLLGETKSGTHCPACRERHGQVKTLLEWMRLPAPYCKCRCHLAEIGKDIAEDYTPPEPPPDRDDEAVKNRVFRVRVKELCLSNRWSDAARIASAAARLAKYGAMMGLKPWGVEARAAAAAKRSGKPRASKPAKTAGGSSGSRSGRKTPSYGGAGDKSNDICFRCGGKGHWAAECPDVSRAQASRESAARLAAAAAAARRLQALPERPGGYYRDGQPVLRDLPQLKGLSGDPRLPAFRAVDEKATAEAWARRNKAVKDWADGVESTVGRIAAFHSLVGALSGVAAGVTSGSLGPVRPGLPRGARVAFGRAARFAKGAPDIEARVRDAVAHHASEAGLVEGAHRELSGLTREWDIARGRPVRPGHAEQIPPHDFRKLVSSAGGWPNKAPGWAAPSRRLVGLARRSPAMRADEAAGRARIEAAKDSLKDFLRRNIPAHVSRLESYGAGLLEDSRAAARTIPAAKYAVELAEGMVRRAKDPAHRAAYEIELGGVRGQLEDTFRFAESYGKLGRDLSRNIGGYLDKLRSENPLSYRPGDENVEEIWQTVRGTARDVTRDGG